MKINYYDIGLNLFCRQFPDPQRILDDAAKNGVGCILTGTDTRENKKIHEYLKANDIYVRYFSSNPRIQNYLRISIGTDLEMDRFIAVLKEYLK